MEEEDVKITFTGSKSDPITINVKGINDEGKVEMEIELSETAVDPDCEPILHEVLAYGVVQLLKGLHIQVFKKENLDPLAQLELNKLMGTKPGEA